MRIASTKRPPKPLCDVAQGAENHVGPTDDGDPPVGFLAVSGDGATLEEAVRINGVLGVPVERGDGFHDFMGTRGVKLARGLWKQIAPALPPHLQSGVKAAWIVLDATALISKYTASDGTEGGAFAELALDAAALGLDAAALVNSAGGYADNAQEIGDLGVLLRFGKDVAKGTDFVLVGTEGLLKDNVPLYKAGKSYLGLVETALGRKDLALSAGRWLVTDHRPNYYATLEPGMVERLSKSLQEKGQSE